MKRFYVMDEELKGFGVRVYASGRKVFVLRYTPADGPRRYMSLGDFGPLTVDQARRKALELLGEVAQGGDPAEQAQERKATPTVSELCDEFVKRYAKPHKKSWRTDESRIERFIKPRWGRRRATSVKATDVVALRDELGEDRQVEANRVVTLVHTIWSRGIEWGRLPRGATNPAAGVEKFKEQARERWLTRDEVARLFAAIEAAVYDRGSADSLSGQCVELLEADGPRRVSEVAEHIGHPRRKTTVLLSSLVDQGRIVRVSRGVYGPLPEEARAVSARGVQLRAIVLLYLLTGLRKRELLGAQWRHCDLEHRLLRIVDTKNGREHRVHLSEPAVEIIRSLPKVESSPYLFPGRRANQPLVNIDKPWRRIRERAGLEDVTLHDLRRTVGSWLVQAGVPLPTIKKALNQSTDFAAQIYARIGDDTVRGALESHGQMLGEVVPMLRGEESNDEG